MLEDDAEGTKEERSYRQWVNSLGIEDVNITNLYEECRDGMLLLRVIDKIEPGSVNWKMVEKNPNIPVKRINNCNYAVEVCKNIGIKAIGVNGADINKGNRKMILTLVWQLVRMQFLKIVGGQTEKDLIKWGNDRAKNDIKDFKDKSLASGKYLIELAASIEPRSVNWDLVQEGETEEEKGNNAKYAIAIARKLGAVIFAVWEDIVSVSKGL